MFSSFLTLYRAVWRYAEGYRRYFVIGNVAAVLSTLVSMTKPVVFALFIDALQRDGLADMRAPLAYVAVMAAIPIVHKLIQAPARRLELLAAYHATRRFNERTYEALTNMPRGWHVDHHSGATISRMQKGAQAINAFAIGMFRYIENGAKFAAAIIAIGAIGWIYGVFALICFAAITFVLMRADELLRQHMNELNEHDHRIALVRHDYLSNIGTILSLRLERLTQREFSRRILAALPSMRRVILLGEIKWSWQYIGAGLLKAIVLGVVIWNMHTDGGPVLIGVVVALYQYLDKLDGVFLDFAWQSEQLAGWRAGWQSAEPLLRDFARQERLGTNRPALIGPWETLEISKIRFRYAPRKPQVLRGAHLTLRRGERIALVGASGCGKSTLLSLIRGQYPPGSWEVRRDGRAVGGRMTLAERTMLIPQEPELFENTLEYNITLGTPCGKEEILRACAVARFDEVLERMPKGLRTNIKEKGVNLSGGEKQRLALARGIFFARDSEIVLMDEAMSSVDAHNEALIHSRIASAFRGKSVVLTTHRLGTLKDMDRIYVLDAGRIAEEGTYAELMAKNGLFAKLARRQAKRRKRRS